MAKDIKCYFKTPGTEANSGPVLTEAAFLAATKEVKTAEKKLKTAGGKRGTYSTFSSEKKAKVAKYAVENGVTALLRHFSKSGEFRELKESTVRGWMNAYKKEIKKASADGNTIIELPEKKRGRPLLLGEDLEEQVKVFLHQVRGYGGVINAPIALAASKGIVMAKDANMLSENGGSITLTKDWAKRLLGRMGFVKRKASTKARITPEHFEELKTQYLQDIETVVKMEDIPPQLIINWDQTAIKYVPVSCWTHEKKGSKRVEIAGIDDKRQITAVLAGTLRCKNTGGNITLSLVDFMNCICHHMHLVCNYFQI